MVCFSLLRVAVRLFIASRARMMSAFWSSSVPTTSVSVASRARSRSSRPLIALLSSSKMVPSWATPPPLSRNDRAPSTSSTSGLRPVDESGMLSPSSSRPCDGALLGRLERDVLLTEQAHLADVGDRVVGELDVVADAQGDLGVPADPLDVGHLTDGDVVDHDRRPRDDVEDVLELGGDRDGVLLVDRRAGQRQVVGAVELAAAHQQRRRAGRRASQRRRRVMTHLRAGRRPSAASPRGVAQLGLVGGLRRVGRAGAGRS